MVKRMKISRWQAMYGTQGIVENTADLRRKHPER